MRRVKLLNNCVLFFIMSLYLKPPHWSQGYTRLYLNRNLVAQTSLIKQLKKTWNYGSILWFIIFKTDNFFHNVIFTLTVHAIMKSLKHWPVSMWYCVYFTNCSLPNKCPPHTFFGGGWWGGGGTFVEVGGGRGGSKIGFRPSNICSKFVSRTSFFRVCEFQLTRHLLESVWYFQKPLAIFSLCEHPYINNLQLSHCTTKPTKWAVRLANTHTAQSDQSLQCVAKDPSFLHVDSEDSDQTGQMPRLIWVFAGHTGHFVGFGMRRLISLNFQIPSVDQQPFHQKTGSCLGRDPCGHVHTVGSFSLPRHIFSNTQ